MRGPTQPTRSGLGDAAGGVHTISLRELRSLRSNTRGKHEDEAREYARGPQALRLLAAS